jgi:hypothetical protein
MLTQSRQLFSLIHIYQLSDRIEGNKTEGNTYIFAPVMLLELIARETL